MFELTPQGAVTILATFPPFTYPKGLIQAQVRSRSPPAAAWMAGSMKAARDSQSQPDYVHLTLRSIRHRRCVITRCCFPPPFFANALGYSGYGTMTVSKLGAVSITGKLGDTTALMANDYLHEDGSFPLFSTLYSTKALGRIGGTVAFSNQPGSDLSGTLSWIKPEQKSGLYRGGFQTAVSLLGSKYETPKKGQTVLQVSNTPGNTEFSAEFGGVNTAFLETMTLSTANKVSPAVTGTNDLKITISTGSGTMSGSFIPPGGSKKASIYGGIFQKQSLGAGVFVTGRDTGVWGFEHK